MTISFDNAGGNLSNSPSAATFTVSASASVGYVGVLNGAAAWSPSSMTWGASSMTEVSHIDNIVSTGWRLYIYAVNNPPTGSQTITCTSASSSGGIYLIAGSYIGTSTSSTNEAFHADTINGTTLTNTVTVSTANAWTIAIVSNSTDGTSNPTASTGATRRFLQSGILALMDSNGAPGTGSQSMSYTVNSGGVSGGLIMSVPPPTAAATAYGYSMLMRGV